MNSTKKKMKVIEKEVKNDNGIFYTLPLHKSKYSGWVWDAKGNFVFQFESEFTDKGQFVDGCLEMQDRILKSLNADSHEPIPELNLEVKDAIELWNDNKLLILIRGWGNLTGVGAHNFTGEKACKIQDNFVKWIIEKLSNKAQ